MHIDFVMCNNLKIRLLIKSSNLEAVKKLRAVAFDRIKMVGENIYPDCEFPVVQTHSAIIATIFFDSMHQKQLLSVAQNNVRHNAKLTSRMDKF